MLPGPALRAELRGAPELTARAVHGSRGAGHLMIEMIRTLAADVDVLEPAAAAAVAQGVEHILVAGLSLAAGGGAVGGGPGGAGAGGGPTAAARPGAHRGGDRGGAARLGEHAAPGVRRPGVHDRGVDLGAAPRRRARRPRRPDGRAPHDRRHRVLVGVRGRVALQPGVPRPVRGYGAGGAGGSTTNCRRDRST